MVLTLRVVLMSCLAGSLGMAGVVGVANYPRLAEHSAWLAGSLATETQVRLFWGAANGCANSAAWQNVRDLGNLPAGGFTTQLTGLDTFRPYFFAFRAFSGQGESWSAPASFRPQAPGICYATGFESGELFPFVPGPLEGQGGAVPWRVKEGAAFVAVGVPAHGAQAVASESGLIQVECAQPQPVLWMDAFYRDGGSASPPLLPTNAAAAVVVFSADRGVLALDGDGQGNGVFVRVAPIVGTNQFIRVTLRLDYSAGLYDVWINGARRRDGLGFKDDSVQQFRGFLRRASQTTLLDDFSLSTWGLDADSDGDGIADLDEAKFCGSYALWADSDGDGLSDLEEVLAGTDPGAANSRFALQMDTDTDGRPRVRFPTITGREYTLQTVKSLSDRVWEGLPALTGILGNGAVWSYAETNRVSNCFYRARVSHPGGLAACLSDLVYGRSPAP